MFNRFPRRIPTSEQLRPERPALALSWFDRLSRKVYIVIFWPLLRLCLRPSHFAAQVVRASEALAQLNEAEFLQKLTALRAELTGKALNRQRVISAFALIREASGRSLGMRHHTTQIKASFFMLQGMMAEMATGEGKTLACTLASATAALAGIKVHLITTNDYLAERDCEEMQPLFKYLGLHCSVVINERTLAERQACYAADIVYTSNNELVFDYLKDSIVLGEARGAHDIYRNQLKGIATIDRLMHQGLVFAIVDEADSVLIDESRTPLVISGGEVALKDSEALLNAVMSFTQDLVEELDFYLDEKNRRAVLTDRARDAIEARDWYYEGAPKGWYLRARAMELVTMALSALHFFERDKHYIVRDDKVMIVDEYTGRLAEDRSWEGGLHQLIEIKESCELTSPQKTLAKISYQKFFRKYFYLSGMSGTAQEVGHELFGVYGLRLVKVPLLRASRRKLLKHQVVPTLAEKDSRIIQAVEREIAKGRSVLVGTATVALSHRLEELMIAAGIPVQLLTAKQDADEAAVVAAAGQPRAVTIATSMAGRGTDIKLHNDVRDAGGLHVIIAELQDARRIDRQLEGRCARQGDPGSVEYILSRQDPLVQVYAARVQQALSPFLSLPMLGSWLGFKIQRFAQSRLEQRHRIERKFTLRGDERERNLLAFLGDDDWR